MRLKSQVPCVMPEHVVLSTVPGPPPLSRWIAQMDGKFLVLDGNCAKPGMVVAPGSLVTSVFFRRSSILNPQAPARRR